MPGYIYLFFIRITLKINESASIFEMRIELMGLVMSKLIPDGFLEFGPYVVSGKYV